MNQAVSINPTKVAPGLGAGFAAQSFKKAMPFYHAAPGCNFLSKVLLTQHFMEPIATSGSDIKETALIFGGTKELQNAIDKFCQKSNPELVFILSSSIPEIRGEDYTFGLKFLKEKFPEVKFVVVPTPDFEGGFSRGFASLVMNAVKSLAEGGEKIQDQINLFPASYMSAADIEELTQVVESFGFSPIIIPDLSSGADGSKEKFSSMSLEGTSIKQIQMAGRSVATFSIGESLRSAGQFLQENFSVKHIHLNSITGIAACDELIKELMIISSQKEVPFKIKKARARLKDIMIDTHLLLKNKCVGIALEEEHIAAYKSLFAEIGINSKYCIAPEIHGSSDNSNDIIKGGLFDLEQCILSGIHFDTIISSTHGKELSQKYNIPLIRAGFPVTDIYGYNYRKMAGYNGTIETISNLANTFAAKRT